MVYLPDGDRKNEQTADIGSAKKKITRYCTYQERAHSEVEAKLYSFNLHYNQVQELLAWLITEDYLNEERFAIAFAGGRFRMKQWGKNKIKLFLQRKRVSEYSINIALNQLDEQDYQQTLIRLITRKSETIAADNIYELRNKVARSIIVKGYDPEIVWQQTKTIIE